MNRRGFLRFGAAAPAIAAIVSKAGAKPVAPVKPIEIEAIEPDTSGHQWASYDCTVSVCDSIFLPQPNEYMKRFGTS